MTTYTEYVQQGYRYEDWLKLSFLGKARFALRSWPRHFTVMLCPFSLHVYKAWGFSTSQEWEAFNLGPLSFSWWCR